MGALQNKTILLISPQSWGKMFLSKHHYAMELARQGNTVYFLQPPDDKKTRRSRRISIEPHPAQPNLYIIHHRLSFPYNIKFHLISLFHRLMKVHVKKILKHIGKPLDIIWSFDLGNLYPFEFFSDKALKIFHPVDEPCNPTAFHSAKGAQIIFSVTEEILNKYQYHPAPKHLIHHGVAEEFLLPGDSPRLPGDKIRVAYSGNLLRTDIDRNILLQIIKENQEVQFESWGSYKTSHSNIGGAENEATRQFIAELVSLPNNILHGVVSAGELAKSIHRMDAFLICYDVQKDQSGGTNYHKIMEYLSTGKVIISNNVTTYRNAPELVQMIEHRENNSELPALFRKIIRELDRFNSPDLQQKRVAFAKDNSYTKQVERIGKILYGE